MPPMPKAILVVQSRPSSSEREAEYNDWYSNTHVPDILKVPGFTGARRFKLSDKTPMPPDPSVPTYLAIYEIDSDDPGAVVLDMITRAGDGRIGMSDVLQMDPLPSTVLYESTT